MERNDRKGESAPLHPKPAGTQHNETNSCQHPPGTPRYDARPAPSWEDIDSDVALRTGLGYLHACDGFDDRGLPATSSVLVDRPANDPSSDSATKKGLWSDDDFDKTIEITKPDMENVQLYCDETQQLTTQHRPARAVASSEARLTTRDFGRERTAGPYSPDSHDLLGLLQGATSTVGAQRGAASPFVASTIGAARARTDAVDAVQNIARDRLSNYIERTEFERSATTLDATRRVMTTPATDADMGDDDACDRRRHG